MDAIIRLPELLGWAIFGLVGIQIACWVYGALGKTAIGHAELHDGAFFEGSAVLLIAVCCWLLRSSIFGEGVMRSLMGTKINVTGLARWKTCKRRA